MMWRATRFVVCFLLACASSAATQTAPEAAQAPGVEIRTFSGSPLLLHLDIQDPSALVRRVVVESEEGSLSYRIPAEASRDPFRLMVQPFLRSGIHELRVALYGEPSAAAAPAAEVPLLGETFEIGFVDFVFGRDNLSFGNNANFESNIGTFAEVLENWIHERFGGVSDRDLVLLADTMYGLFGANTGRCYAFAGMEVRYWGRGDLLPTYYEDTHDIRGNMVRYQREMGYLQLDMVYSHFLEEGGGSFDLGPMDPADALRQAEYLVEAVRAGRPVVAGFSGPDLHHAMVVFGYIRHPGADNLDLLVANNWKSDEALNLHSRNAEMVRLRGDGESGLRTIDWLHHEGPRDREIHRLFAVELRPEPYEPDPAPLAALIDARLAALHESGMAVVVVEEAAGAWLTDGEQFSGRLRSQTKDEIQGVIFDRVGRAFRFAYPADAGLDLELRDDGGARILRVSPGVGIGGEFVSIDRTEPGEEEGLVTRRISLAVETARASGNP